MSNRTASTNHASLSDAAYARHNIPTDSATAALIERLRAEGQAGMEAIRFENAKQSLSTERLERIEKCDVAVNMFIRYAGDDMREREAGAMFAAVVLSRQVVRHLSA